MSLLQLFSVLTSSFLAMSSTAHAQWIQPGSGELIPVKAIKEKITTAYLETNQSWCTPAVMIGPRTFITAAHCTSLIPANRLVKIVGPGFQKMVHVQVLSTPIHSDDDFFSGPQCEATIKGIVNNSVLTPDQLLSCWFVGGEPDLALLIAEENLPGPMLSLEQAPLLPYETVDLLGYSPKCGGDLGHYHRIQMRTFGFHKAQVVFDGHEMGENSSNVSPCGGDSGGIYFRKKTGGASIAAIHSASINYKGPYNLYGKRFFLPEHFSGGANLTEASVVKWIDTQIKKHDLKICGFNISCVDTVL